MADIRRYSLAAVVLLVVLRVGIGWQLLYEGLWKIDTLSSQAPWSSDGYLKSSQGPMRNLFRAMTGDPDDKSWLDPETVAARWDGWQRRFVTHYALSNSQAAELDKLVNGSASYEAILDLPASPEGVDFASAKLKDTVSFDSKAKRLRINGKLHLTPTEKQTLDQQVAEKQGAEYDAYRKALDDAYSRSNRLAYNERVRAHLMGDPDVAGKVDGRIGQIDLYNQMIDRYEARLASASLSFEQDHLTRIWSDTRQKARDLAGPVMALDKELKESAMAIPTVDQLKRGPLPEPWTRIHVVNMMTIAGLTALGILLIIGLFTRFAAFSAALMVFGFYMAMPPLPGVPDAPGPEHSFIVNKNLVEVFALLALTSVPTGYWFGVDKLLARLLAGRSKKLKK